MAGMFVLCGVKGRSHPHVEEASAVEKFFALMLPSGRMLPLSLFPSEIQGIALGLLRLLSLVSNKPSSWIYSTFGFLQN